MAVRRLSVLVTGSATLFALLLCEALLRLHCRGDEDGNRYCGSLRLLPHRIPQRSIARDVAQRTAPGSAVVYDPDLGWTAKPGVSSQDRRYAYERHGVRQEAPTPDLTERAAPGVTRLVLIGDSFTHGDDVRFSESWGAVLGRGLGAGYEVLNLGFRGHGMDQALWRMTKGGLPLRPHLVLFGLQGENTLRNLNLVRKLLYPRSVHPYSKPRYVLRDGEPQLINHPALPPDAMVALLSRFDQWEHAGSECAYEAPLYQDHPALRSYLVGLLLGVRAARRDQGACMAGRPYEEGSEGLELASWIFEQMVAQSRAAGAELRVVHLPKREDLRRLARGQRLAYAPLLGRIAARAPVIDPAMALLRSGLHQRAASFTGTLHYGPRLNQIVGEVVAAAVKAEPPRRSGRIDP